MKKLLTLTLLFFITSYSIQAQNNSADGTSDANKDTVQSSINKDGTKKKFKKVGAGILVAGGELLL